MLYAIPARGSRPLLEVITKLLKSNRSEQKVRKSGSRDRVYDLFMKQIALGLALAGLALTAQPDLLTLAPAVIARCAPQYTTEARQAGVEGTAVLYIQIHTDGTAHNIKVQRGLGSGLDENAVE